MDNDGKLDNVVRVESSSEAGAGCDFTYLAVTNEARNSIPDTKLNKLMLGLDDFACGSKKEIFVRDDMAYIDSQVGAGNRTIHRIKNGKSETICEFLGSFSYEMNGNR